MKCRKIIILICLNPPLTPTIPRRMAEQISQLPKGVSPNRSACCFLGSASSSWIDFFFFAILNIEIKIFNQFFKIGELLLTELP